MKLFHKGQATAIKIVSLAVGLTVGLVLLAKVELERRYDNCITDKEQTYEVYETFQRNGKGVEEHGCTAGGVAPQLLRNIPEIVSATRYTTQFSEEKLTLDDGNRHYFEMAAFADSCFFDIFATQVIQGDARKILSSAGQCLISQRLYNKIGGEAVGKTFCFASAPNKPMTIAGVFEDYPENSSYSRFDILMSMPSIGTYTWDGSENLLGNDRYHSFVRLCQDADMKKVREEMDQLFQRILPWDDLKQSGYADAGAKLNAVMGSRMSDKTVRTSCFILAVVAFVMLFTAVLNYILVVVSSLVGRARQVAVRKCLGAPRSEFYLSSLAEAAAHLLLALAAMALLLYAGQDWIRDLLGVSVASLFSRQTVVVVVTVCLVVLLCCGLLPGFIYARIPLSYAYRLYSESKRTWKLSLLAFQFVLSAMLLCVLTTIYRQYDFMLSKDMGYDYKNLAYIKIDNPSDSTYSLVREIEKLASVECAATSSVLYIHRQSGNNIGLPNDTRELFNYACLYWAEDKILQTMGLQLVEGKAFTPKKRPGWMAEAIVDERFAEMLKAETGWDDVVGRSILSSEIGQDNPLTIVGVVKNFTIGTLLTPDERPAMMINGNIYTNYVFVRLHQLTPDGMQAVQQLCDRLYPDAELNVKRYADELADQYQETQHTRDLIMIGCIASLLITLIGLIGYIRDEVQRRTRELGIRKVFGATVIELQSLFLQSITLITIPTIIVGALLGYALSQLMMEQFPEHVSLPWWLFAIDAIVVLLIIIVVVVFQTRRIALKNPIESLRTE